jgi:drug/metabolite transporter (DMT)-like permease
LDWRIGLGFAGIVLCTVCANLALKIGAMAPAASRVVLGVLSWQSVAGLALFGLGGVVYSVLLRAVPLNVAQVFASMQFVGVILAANFVLGEPISGLRWAGIGFTVLGIAIVGATARG